MKWQYLLLALFAIPFIAFLASFLGLFYILLLIIETIMKPFVKQKDPPKPTGLASLLLNLIPKNENITKRTKLADQTERGDTLRSV